MRASYSKISPLFSLSSSLPPSPSPPNRLGENSGQVGCHLTCHMSISYWLIGFAPYPLTLNSGFPSTHEMTHVHMGPTWLSLFGLLKLDTWLNVSHSTPAMCHPTLYTSKNMQFRLSQNSTKFDMIARFCETISTVKSVSSSEI